MNLMHIAREANRSGDAKTLFHALDLLERLMPIATGRIDAFMAFCAELETEGWLEGPATGLPHKPRPVIGSNQLRQPRIVRVSAVVVEI